MNGIIFAFASAFFLGIMRLLHKYNVHDECPISYSFLGEFFSMILLIPMLVIFFELPSEPIAWVIALLSGILWSITLIASNYAFKNLSSSLKIIIHQSRLIIIVIAGYFIFNDSIGWNQLIAIGLIITGIIIIANPKNIEWSWKGFALTVLGAFCSALALSSEKFVLNYFTPESYIGISFMLPALILSPFALQRQNEIKRIIKNRFRTILAACLSGVLATYFIYRAYNSENISVVIPIIESSILVTVVGGIILLKERQDILRKIIGAVIVLAGAILVAM
ncbi:DMT family transporter [Candidatus Woesearchaeota archaeon]|nr:DMT family transporter [Candidatus Woesearchaeota archaeon]